MLGGESVDEDTLIRVLLKRVQLDDCHQQGWMLEGFPQTREQAVKLSQAGVIPTCVFAMETDTATMKQRLCSEHYKEKFGVVDHILQVRLNKANKEYARYTRLYPSIGSRCSPRTTRWSSTTCGSSRP